MSIKRLLDESPDYRPYQGSYDASVSPREDALPSVEAYNRKKHAYYARWHSYKSKPAKATPERLAWLESAFEWLSSTEYAFRRKGIRVDLPPRPSASLPTAKPDVFVYPGRPERWTPDRQLGAGVSRRM